MIHRKSQIASWLATWASAGLLVACGGCGSSSTPEAAATLTATAASVTLSGTAAKGLMAHADVGVFAVNPDGSVAGTALATTTTDTLGRYSLSFVGSNGQPVVIRVSARADGSTTHADEVTGTAQPLPAGFAMRSLVTPSASGAVLANASITPFSEMAVAAALRASGGITPANALQAITTLSKQLGFNPINVAAKTLGTASGSDEQMLAVMLTLVSQLAQNGDLGCSGAPNPGARVQCVVEALGAASRSDSGRLGAGNALLPQQLGAALGAVLGSPAVRQGVSAALLVKLVASLAAAGIALPPLPSP